MICHFKRATRLWMRSMLNSATIFRHLGITTCSTNRLRCELK